MAGQSATMDELLTGRQNLDIIGRMYHLGPARSRERAGELLGQFGLTDAAGRMVKTYSGGMRRRLDLAASLVADPPVLFLDEPTSGLDPVSRAAMWQAIRDLVARGTTVLLTTQHLDEADQLADDIVVISGGVVAASGTPAELTGSRRAGPAAGHAHRGAARPAGRDPGGAGPRRADRRPRGDRARAGRAGQPGRRDHPAGGHRRPHPPGRAGASRPGRGVRHPHRRPRPGRHRQRAHRPRAHGPL